MSSYRDRDNDDFDVDKDIDVDADFNVDFDFDADLDIDVDVDKNIKIDQDLSGMEGNTATFAITVEALGDKTDAELFLAVLTTDNMSSIEATGIAATA